MRDAEKMLMEQEDGKLGVPNGRSLDVVRYVNYLAERAKGMRCRSNFYGNTKWWNDHIAVLLTPKEKERAEKSGDQQYVARPHVSADGPRSRTVSAQSRSSSTSCMGSQSMLVVSSS